MFVESPLAYHNDVNRFKPRNDFQKVTDKHAAELLSGPKFICVSCMNWSNNNKPEATAFLVTFTFIQVNILNVV